MRERGTGLMRTSSYSLQSYTRIRDPSATSDGTFLALSLANPNPNPLDVRSTDTIRAAKMPYTPDRTSA